MEIKVVQLGPLEDPYTLFTDEPAGLPKDFGIEEDAELDDNHLETVDVEGTPSLIDLSPLTVLYILRTTFSTPEVWSTYDRDALFDILGERFAFSDVDRDLVRALQLIAEDESFWTEWEVFNWCTQALCGLVVAFDYLPALSPADIARSMLVADTVSSQQDAQARYSPEVLSYIAVTCTEDGVWALPYPMDPVQPRILELLRRKGWKNPPLETVKELGEEKGGSIEPENEVSVQARRYWHLKKYIRELISRTEREIEVYKTKAAP